MNLTILNIYRSNMQKTACSVSRRRFITLVRLFAVLSSSNFFVYFRNAIPLRIIFNANEERFFVLFFDTEDETVFFWIVAVDQNSVYLLFRFERVDHYHLTLCTVFVRHYKYMLFMLMIVAAAAIIAMYMFMFAHVSLPHFDH